MPPLSAQDLRASPDSTVILGRSAKMVAQDTIFGKFNEAAKQGTIIEEVTSGKYNSPGKKKFTVPVPVR